VTRVALRICLTNCLNATLGSTGKTEDDKVGIDDLREVEKFMKSDNPRLARR